MKRFLKKELIILLGCIVLFISLRSINYQYHLNFTGDQAMFSIKALELYKNKEITLLGPETSMRYQSRVFYQGPATYYMLMVFLILGNWDPMVSSYLFMIFCSLMIIPLYYGVKKLMNIRSAWIVVIIYILSPYYINYSRFLWNPNFQFSLLPVLILLMGLYKQYKKWWIFFAMSILLGILLHFHYQFVVVIAGIFVFYFVIKRIHPKYIPLFIAGLGIGVLPMAIFELRHNFYNFRTMIFLFQHRNELDRGGGSYPHYYLSLSLMLLLAAMGVINRLITYIFSKKLQKKDFLFKIKTFLNQKTYGVVVVLIFVFLLTKALIANVPVPKESFWAGTNDWNYLADHRIYEIVKQEHLTNYNIANLTYDTLAWVPKYLLLKDGVPINNDYYHEDYLFVVYKNDNYMEATSYEVATFKPHKVLKTWKINDHYKMFLLKRTS